MTQLAVAYSRRPLEGMIFPMREGMTIQEIVEEINPPSHFWIHGVVIVGDEEIPRHMWRFVRPKCRGDVTVPVHLATRLQGGNTFRTIAMIAVFAATLFISMGGVGILAGGTAAAGIAGGWFAAGSMSAALLAGAVGIGGSLLISALSRPPSADLGTTTEPTQGAASVSGNALGLGDPVPRVFGTADVTPPLLCMPLKEIIGTDEYVEAVVGLAGPHKWSNIRIGDIPIDNIPNMTYQVNEGKPGDPIQTLIQRQSYTAEVAMIHSRPQNDPTNQNYVLNQTNPAASLPYWHAFSSRKAPDELWAVYAWSGGLSDSVNSGTNIAVPVRVRFRRRGSTTWVNLPEIHFDSKSGKAFQKHFKFFWSPKPSGVTQPPTDEGPYIAYGNVPAQALAGGTTGGWRADTYFYPSGTAYYSAANYSTTGITACCMTTEGVDVYLDPGTFPKDFYDFQVMIGNVYTAALFSQNAAYTIGGVVYDFFGYQLSGSVFVYQRTRLGIQDEVQLARVSSVWNSPPVTSNELSTLSIYTKNLNISKIVVNASGYTYDWNGAEWASFPTVTSNPAPHWVDCHVNLIALPIPYDLIDNASVVAWRTFCATNGYQVNWASSGKNLQDVADTIAGSGYGRTRRSEKWGILIDQDVSASAPIQVFTPRNLTAFHFERAFPNVPSGLRCTYNDSTNQYESSELVVLRKVSPVPDDGIYQKITYDTLVTSAEVQKRAAFDLGQMTERPIFYKGNAALEHIIATKGDLVGISYDTLDSQAGFAYITAVASSGGNVTGLTLDGTIPATQSNWGNTSSMWSSYASEWKAPRYGVMMRLLNQTMLTKEVTLSSDPTNTLTFVSPFAVSANLAPGCFLTSGRLGTENMRVKVLDITPKEDMTADITFVDEAPQLFSGGLPI